MLRAVGYTRVSTPDQVNNTSLDYQEKRITDYAKKCNVDLVNVFREEGKSATNTIHRPEYNVMIDYIITHEIDILYVTTVDRLYRIELDCYKDIKLLMGKGVKIVFIDNNLSSDDDNFFFILAILIAQAANFSRNLSMRTKIGQQARAEYCMHTGGQAPYGFIVDSDSKLLVEDPETAPAVRKMFQLYADGFGVSEIKEQLKKDGYSTVNGNEFEPNTINSMLKNEKYRGCFTWDKAAPRDSDGKRNSHKCKKEYQKIEGGCPRLVSDDLFESVQQKLSENSEKRSNHKPNRYYPLTGMIYCECGSKMCGGVKYSKNIPYHKYSCEKKSMCNVSPITAEYLEAYVINAICLCLFSEPNISDLITLLNNINKENKINSDKQYRSLKSQLTGKQKRCDNLVKALELGNIRPTVLQAIGKNQSKQQEINDRIANLHRNTHKFTEDDLQQLKDLLFSSLMNDNSVTNQYLLQNIIDKVVVGNESIQVTFKSGIAVNKSTKNLLKGNGNIMKNTYSNVKETDGIILGFKQSDTSARYLDCEIGLKVKTPWMYDVYFIPILTTELHKATGKSVDDLFELIGEKVMVDAVYSDNSIPRIKNITFPCVNSSQEEG